MATLGKRNMKEKNLLVPGDREHEPALVAGINLTIYPTFTQPVAVESIIAPTIGTRIMREDFVTESGFMIGVE
jgi:hypothetical protein